MADSAAWKRLHGVSELNSIGSAGIPTDIGMTGGTLKRQYPVERRKHRRYTVKQRAFVLLGSNCRHPIRMKKMSMGEIALAVYKLKPAIIGEIQDFSMGGLGLIYSQKREPIKKEVGLDILVAEDNFHLGNLSYRSVFDMAIDSCQPGCPVETRYMGVAFKNLGEEQASQLLAFAQTQKSHSPVKG